MTTLLDALKDSLGYFLTAPAWLLLLIVVNLVGVYLQWVQWFPNKLVPIMLVSMSIILLELLISPSTITNPSPRLVIGLVGFIHGSIAWGIHGGLVFGWRKWWSQTNNSNQNP